MEFNFSKSGRFIVDMNAAGRRRFRTESDARAYAAWATAGWHGKVYVWQQDKTTKHLTLLDTYRAGQPTI